ncbi:MAG: haloacid dehalogenase [Actinomycetota bacterium]
MDLQSLSAEFQRRLDEKNAAREVALPAARQATRHSANAIRAIHRGEGKEAARLLDEARAALDKGEAAVSDHPDVRWAGFLHDAQKEYAEAQLTRAVIEGNDLPSPDDIGVTVAAYLNGIAETIGELRRSVLDLLRTGDLARAEELLSTMDDMFYVLVGIDYPDAITGNLRRWTDVARGIIERTRGDLTTSIVQRDLREALDRHTGKLGD